MEIIKKTSPNFTEGREGKKITGIVIHWIGQGSAESTIQWFASKNSQVSAHYLVSNNDKVYQFVKDEDTAWHCGNWNKNTSTIGIEHDAVPDRPLTEQGYKTSAELVRTLCKKYSIPIDRKHIIKHSEVKPTQCCGTVDIDKIISMAKDDCSSKLKEVQEDLIEMRKSRDKWKKASSISEIEIKRLEGVVLELTEQVQKVQEIYAKNKTPLTEFKTKELLADLFRRLKGGD